MNHALLVALLALLWVAITGVPTLPNLLLGAVIGAAALWVVRDRVPRPAPPGRLRRIAALAALFVRELAVGSVRVAVLVLSPDLKRRLRPAIVAFPLTARGDGEIALLAGLLTLTPGTIGVDVSEDGRVLYLHLLEARDREAIVAGIAGGLEARVIEVFR